MPDFTGDFEDDNMADELNGDGDEAVAKVPKSRTMRIEGNLRRARKLGQTEGNEDRVRYLLEEAQILAVLELADATRNKNAS